MNKNELTKALITKICTERKVPELRYETAFFEENERLVKKILERKADLPSIEFLQKTFKFEPVETEMTMADIQESLDVLYFKESCRNVIKEFAEEIKQNGEPTDRLDKLMKRFNNIRGVLTPNYVCEVSTDRSKVADEYESQMGDANFVKSGFDIFDNIVAPKLGDLIMVCGPTKRGKSASMLQMQKNAIVSGDASIYFSLEMDLVEINNRIIAGFQKYKFNDLKFHKVSRKQYEQALDEIFGEYPTPTHIVTRQNESAINLGTIEKYIQDYKPRVVFVDYLTLLDDVGYDWNAESPTKQLKRMAQQYRCVIYVGTQAVSEFTDLNNDEVPGPEDVFGNKTWVRDVNHFLGVTSIRRQNDENSKDDMIKIVMKYKVGISRDSKLPEFTYYVTPETGKWEDVSQEYAMGIM